MLLKEILLLLKKDFFMEWRQHFSINGIILYMLSTIFVCYLSFNARQGQIDAITWNALFWIILLFAGINAIAKSFFQENTGLYFYLATIVSPQAIILSKIIYNAILMSLIGLLGYLFYSLVMGNPVADPFFFILHLLIASLAFSSTLTMLASLANNVTNTSTMMAILAFPSILPILLMSIKVSKNAMDGLARSASYEELIVLGAINCIVLSLSYLLFPLVWKA